MLVPATAVYVNRHRDRWSLLESARRGVIDAAIALEMHEQRRIYEGDDGDWLDAETTLVSALCEAVRQHRAAHAKCISVSRR